MIYIHNTRKDNNGGALTREFPSTFNKSILKKSGWSLVEGTTEGDKLIEATLNKTPLDKMKKGQLVKECIEKGVDPKGTRLELLKRLKDVDSEE